MAGSHHEAGGALVITLVLCGIISAIVLSLFPRVSLQSKGPLSSTGAAQTSLKIIESNFLQTLNHPASFQHTIDRSENASSFHCLKHGSFCSYDWKSIGVVTNASGQVYFANSSQSQSHFSLDGSVCLPDADSRTQCPLSATLQWRPACPGGCTNPKVDIQLHLQVRNDYSGAPLLFRETVYEASLL